MSSTLVSVILFHCREEGGGRKTDRLIYLLSLLDYNKWCKIITSGDQISPRKHHTMAVKGFSVLLFGGGMTVETCHNRVDYIAFGKGWLFTLSR